MFRSILLAAALLATSTVANLTGSGTITYHDYQAIPLDLLKYNPPSCGMPYADLDVTRITAVQTMNTATDCGQCIKVANSNDPSKYVYVLAVDTGGRGLDLSKPSFGKLFNIDDGVGPATWGPVDNSNCVGIWSGMGSGPYDGSTVPAPAASEEPPVVSSSPPQPPPPVQSVAPVISSSSSSVLSTSIAIHLSTTKPPATSVHSTAPPVTIRSTEPNLSSSSSSSAAAAVVASHENSAGSSAGGSSSAGSVSSQDVVVDMAYELGATPEESLSGVGHNAKDELSGAEESSNQGSSGSDEESEADGDSSSGASALGVPVAVLSVLIVAALL